MRIRYRILSLFIILQKLVIDELIKELTSCVTDQNSSVRYETVISISLFGKVCKDTNIDLLSCLVPSLLKSVFGIQSRIVTVNDETLFLIGTGKGIIN